ncbi:MAG: hypothetical protein V4677_07795 [Bacteroidota bacterium]
MKLTVLTEKVSVINGLGYFLHSIKLFLYKTKVNGFEHLKKSLANLFAKKPYTGHYAVTRSLCEGLKQIGMNYNYNPPNSSSVNEHVIVLSDVDTLKIAIDLKVQGKIKQLLAGPNLMVRSNEYDQILAHPGIDKIVVPSEWVKIAYIEDLPVIKDKIIIWPCGVDAELFQPKEANRLRNILVYWKTGPEDLLMQIEKVLKEQQINYVVLKYGHYTQTEYIDKLKATSMAIFCSTSESQGIALQEAWSMNVPTFVWQPQELTIKGKKFNQFSSAPYLNEKTGSFFKTIDELKTLLIRDKNNEFNFTPRAVVLEHFTDKVCAKALVDFFNR